MNEQIKSQPGGAAILESASIKKFGLFSDDTLEFSPGINVFIGRNGCGKSHLLKLLYTLVKECGESPGNGSALESMNLENRLAKKLAGVFRPEGDHIGRLVQRGLGAAVRKFRQNSVTARNVDSSSARSTRLA
jgi:recombinational DNA repair ATPase RecF